MLDTAARLLRLLTLLQTHAHWTGAALADRLGVSARTVRADVERLRSLDYDIDATPGVAGGYRLRAGTSVPPVQFDDDEAVAVAVGLRTAATSGVAGVGEHAARAAAKLEQLLPARLRPRLHTVSTAAETVPTTRDLVAPEILTTVSAAIHRREQLRFDYLDRHRGNTSRQVEPHRLVHVTGRWYLVAYDLDRARWRSFRLDRIGPKTPTGPCFAPRAMPDDVATLVTRGRMAALWNYRARVIVQASAETVAARIPAGTWIVEPLDHATSALDAGAHSPELLATYLGALDLDFHIDPDAAPELATAAFTLAERYAAAPRSFNRTQLQKPENENEPG